ncbi:MAG TPA: cystathionine beta-lyase [Methylophilaceae bacterium]|nr:cystathionine beta-lyase [Methylophilaceae bacterium]
MSKKNIWTELVQPEPPTEQKFHSLASSVERASTVVFPDAKSLRNRNWRDKRQYTYGLLGTPTTRRLERKLALLEGGEHCILLPSGLAAISLTLLALLKNGDRVLMPTNAYMPAADAARFMAARFGIEVAFYNPLQPESIVMTGNTRLLWVETPGSVSMEVADLPALAKLAHEHGALVAVDATWAAGIALPVFELGADISIQALTKYQSGGSDVMMGSIVTRDQQLSERLLEAHVYLGMGVSPEDCNIILRSLPHYRLRYQTQDVAARRIAAWLDQQSAIAQVLHPALPGSPGHDVWRRDFTGAASLFSVVFQPHITQQQMDEFVEALQLFHIGYSWGGSVSLAVPYEKSSMREGYPYAGHLVRFYVGLEDADDLIEDIKQAFTRIKE